MTRGVTVARRARITVLGALLVAAVGGCASTSPGGDAESSAPSRPATTIQSRVVEPAQIEQAAEDKQAATEAAILARQEQDRKRRVAVASVIRGYYTALGAKNFAAAWSRLSPAVRETVGGYGAWTAGQADTVSVTVTASQVDSLAGDTATASVRLRTVDLDACAEGAAQRFAGAWTLRRTAGRWQAVNLSLRKTGGDVVHQDETGCAGSGGGEDDAGGEDYSADGSPDTGPSFCATHPCIPNYSNGRGYTIQCADGSYSRSGGIQGACSHHGGLADGTPSSPSYSPPSYNAPSSTPDGAKTVHVDGYYRKDGTYVRPHYRRPPCTYC